MESYTVFDCLEGRARALRGLTSFDGDVALTLWQRNETARTRYKTPNHHTLSLYVKGGRQIRRRCGRRLLSGGEPGIICVLPAGEDSDWDVAGSVEMLHLYFTDKDIETAVRDRWQGSRSLRSATFARRPVIADMMRALLRLDWDSPADRIAISHLSLSIIALVLKLNGASGDMTLRKGGLAPRALADVHDYIDANIDRALTVDELAAISGLSPFHFSRTFRETTGVAPHRHIMRVRIERAATLIQSGRMPLAQIALETGHSSQSHLARRFRELMGLSPADYAQQFRQKRRLPHSRG
jgi:AraC family transcriptional regulator